MSKFRFTAGPWTLISDEHAHTLQYDENYQADQLPKVSLHAVMPELEHLNDLLYLLVRCSQKGERRFFLLTEQAVPAVPSTEGSLK